MLKRKFPSYRLYPTQAKYARGPVGRVIFQRKRRVQRRSKSLRRFNYQTAGYLGIERKFYDTSLIDTALTNETACANGEKDPSATSMVSTPAQGDGEQNRDGKQIACLYLEISGSLNFFGQEDQANPVVDRGAFVACVLDTQSNGAQMNSEDCFKNTSADGTLGTDVMRNLLFSKRFRILKQKRFHVPPTIGVKADGTISTSGHTHHFKWFIPLKGMKINFNGGTTASIANVIDNSIHIIAWKTEVAEVVNIGYNARLRFVG